MVRTAVFASGTGSNLQALLDRLNARDDSPARIVLVVSDRADAGALTRARAAGVDARVIAVTGRTAEDVAHETLAALRDAAADMIALAGYLRLLPAEVIAAYRHRILNVHPALLPAFGGKGMYGIRVHRAVLDAGCFVTGATVHFVDERYDEGRTVVQWPVPVLRGDTPETLAARVLEVEHVLYPLAVEWLARRISRGEGPVETSGTPEGRHRGFAADSPSTFAPSADEREIDAAVHRTLSGLEAMP